MNPDTLNRIAPFAIFAVFGSLFLWLATVLRRRFLARYGRERLESALRREKELGIEGDVLDPRKVAEEANRIRRERVRKP